MSLAAYQTKLRSLMETVRTDVWSGEFRSGSLDSRRRLRTRTWSKLATEKRAFRTEHHRTWLNPMLIESASRPASRRGRCGSGLQEPRHERTGGFSPGASGQGLSHPPTGRRRAVTRHNERAVRAAPRALGDVEVGETGIHRAAFSRQRHPRQRWYSSLWRPPLKRAPWMSRSAPPGGARLS